MAKYTHYIRVPFTGELLVSVDSDDAQPRPEDLHELFYEQYDIGRVAVTDSKGRQLEVGEWNTHAQVVRGNCWGGTLNEIEIDDTEENSDD